MSAVEELVRGERPSPHVLLIRLTRPAKRNALTNAMVVAIADLLEGAREDVDCRCVVITGDDVAFSAGADIAEVQATDGASVNDPVRVAAWRRIERFPKPLIAAVNGICFGAGNELAMTADFILAGRNARFGQPEVKIGGIAGDGATQRLPRKIGPGLASLMLLSGEPIDAETALRAGLVVEVTDMARTVARALEVAAAIAARAPLAVQETKALIRATSNMGLEAGLAMEREALWRVFGSADRREGMAAFLEKRPAKWSGRW
ncbi:MAG: enoyl-CoA hydratase/isomerase family protein [Rhizobiales bacterium]|nr:enoyl-CoA hydratase/isomerase family protein [Hyphomicrobiales bacterium]